MKEKDSYDLTVKNYVESFFEPIHYSKEVSEAKKKITEVLEPVYAQMKRENENEAFSGFVAKYPTLEALVEAAGLEREKAAQWRDKESTVPLQDFLGQLKERRKQIWITTALFVLAAVYLAAVALSFADLGLVKLVVSLALAAAGLIDPDAPFQKEAVCGKVYLLCGRFRPGEKTL